MPYCGFLSFSLIRNLINSGKYRGANKETGREHSEVRLESKNDRTPKLTRPKVREDFLKPRIGLFFKWKLREI
jgi:hypothetical protein